MSHAKHSSSQYKNSVRSENSVIRLADFRRKRASRVFFNRAELSQLLAVYSTQVAQGEWRDYAIDHAPGVAVFSVYKHTSDRPLFSVIKVPQPKGIEFQVFDSRRRITRSASLQEAIDCLKRPSLRLVRE